MKPADSAMVSSTSASFGTKLSVLSLIDVAACRMPMTSPAASATPSAGPEVTTMAQ
jgi:hypothetical protein